MSDDLVKRLRLIGEREQQCSACYKLIDTADEAADRIEALENALRTLIKSCDTGVMMSSVGVGGMTVATNIKSSWVNNVEAWAVEEARAALEGKNG